MKANMLMGAEYVFGGWLPFKPHLSNFEDVTMAPEPSPEPCWFRLTREITGKPRQFMAPWEKHQARAARIHRRSSKSPARRCSG